MLGPDEAMDEDVGAAYARVMCSVEVFFADFIPTGQPLNSCKPSNLLAAASLAAAAVSALHLSAASSCLACCIMVCRLCSICQSAARA